MAGPAPLQYEQDANGLTRVKFQEEGWNYWDWAGEFGDFRVHYLQAGTQGPPILLIHGYGASGYHWCAAPCCCSHRPSCAAAPAVVGARYRAAARTA